MKKTIGLLLIFLIPFFSISLWIHGEENYQRTLFHNNDLGENDLKKVVGLKQLFPVLNAWIMYKARHRLGIADPTLTGHALPTLGPFLGGLHFLSFFDLELVRTLYYQKEKDPYYPLLDLLYAPVSKEFAVKFRDSRLLESHYMLNSIKHFSNDIYPHQIKELEKGHIERDLEYKESYYVIDGLREELDESLAKMIPKLKKEELSWPLIVSLSGDFEELDRAAMGFFNTKVFIGALHELRDDRLEKGLKRTTLPENEEVVTYLPGLGNIVLNEVSYLDSLSEEELKIPHLIRIETFKDFAFKHSIKLRISFGRLGGEDIDENEELISFNTYQKEDALILHGRLDALPEDKDSRLVTYFKKVFKNKLGSFTLDARIHEITIDLLRYTEGNIVKDIRKGRPLHPYYGNYADESKISYNLQRKGISKRSEIKFLKKLGFTCLLEERLTTYRCSLELATWKEMNTRYVSFIKALTEATLKKSFPVIFSKLDLKLKSKIDDFVLEFNKYQNKMLKYLLQN